LAHAARYASRGIGAGINAEIIVNYNPNDDERHYQPRGRLDPKPPREPKFTSISGVGKRLIESLRPHVSDDFKQRLSISLAGYLLPWVGGRAVTW
jgi:hypothetical protein